MTVAEDRAVAQSHEHAHMRSCVTLPRIRGLYIRPDGTGFEAYGLPVSNVPFTESLRRSYPGRSLKEQFRLFGRVSKTRMEHVGKPGADGRG